MSSKSLGTLTLDLVAKVGGFVSGMDKAERSSAKWRKQVEKNASAAGKAIGAAASVASVGMAVWIKNSIDGAAEIENLAKVAGTSAVEFQRFAAGARTVGIENEKLSDIFKDVNDKVGDFLVTGGGPMADFFEKVAPLVGVTADQFRNLSGPDALGLYVDTLEKAGANSQEMTFFLEALASDTTALLPLLRNGGSELKSMADEAENLGLILSDETVAGAKQFKADLDQLGRVANSVGQQVAAELLPELSNLTDLLRDPATAEAAADMAKAVVVAFTTIIDGARNTVQFIQWAAESAAAFMGGIAADDIVRLNDEIERLEQMKAGGALDRLVFFGRDGMVSYYNDAELDAELVKLRDAVEAAMQGSAPVKIKAEPELITTPPGTGLNLGGAGSSRKVVDAIAKEITALERAAATWGMAADEIKIYDLQISGATKSQIEHAQSLLKSVGALEKKKEAEDNYKSLVESLRTEEEQRSDTLREQMDILREYGDISEEQRKKLEGLIAAQALDTEITLSLGTDAVGLVEAEEKLAEWYANQLEALAKYRESRSDLNEQWDRQEAKIRAEHEEQLTAINAQWEAARREQMQEGFSSILSVAEKYYQGMEGEQAAYTRAALQLGQILMDSKAREGLQSIAISTNAAAMGAYQALASLPVIGPALGAAAAATIYVAGGAAAAKITGMAHDGIDSVPKTGTWILEKGERVTTERTSARLDKTLDAVQNQMQTGSGVVVNIHNAAPGARVEESQGADGRPQIDVWLADFVSDGRTTRAIQQKFNLPAYGK